jgi:hypothetical protein
MDAKRYFEILELAPDASIDELNQAYKDMVNIWHPDRFAHNPRLKKRAEEKLKEINKAYEALRPLVSSGSLLGKNAKAGPYGKEQVKPGVGQEAAERGYQAGTETEAVVEAGTASVLRLWSYLSTRLRRLVTEQVKAFKEGAQTDPPGGGMGQGRSKGRGKGRGGGQERRQYRGGGRRRGGARGGMGRGGA